MRLTAANLPSNDLAYTNCVYVSPTDFALLAKGDRSAKGVNVQIKNIVLMCQGDKRMQDGEIGLNRIVRTSCRIATKDELEVSPYFPPSRSSYMLSCATLNIDLHFKDRTLVVEAEKLEEELKSRLCNHVLTSGQEVAAMWGNEVLILKARDLKLLDLGSATQRSQSTQATTAGMRASSGAQTNQGMITGDTDICFVPDDSGRVRIESTKASATSIFRPDFNFEQLGIGGLDKEFADIFRRAFASRVFPPSIVKELGINHVKGMLLFGPPGTGKTLIARQIGKCLRAREPKIVNGPEVLNKYVGQSEENIRNLFKDAEDEFKKLGDNSQLHIVIFDEIDAICKTRGSSRDGTGVSDSIVNQLLSKIDGVDALNNILLIGMTNRFDMIDEALLRPGRLEVHVEIGLPDEAGRLQILNIHTSKMREASRLDASVNLASLAEGTRNFSGAELEGLVRSAASWAFNRQINTKDLLKPKDVQNIKIGQGDFELALNEVKPAFGVQEEQFEGCMPYGIIPFGRDFERIKETCVLLSSQIRDSQSNQVMSILLEGSIGSGKTALAAHVAQLAQFPFMKLVTPDNYVGMSENARCSAIVKVFEDAYKSHLSLVVLDGIERLLDYVAIGPRFSNAVLQALMVLVKKAPKKEGRRLLVIGTTSHFDFLTSSGLAECFQVTLTVPVVSGGQEIKNVLTTRYPQSPLFPPQEVEKISRAIPGALGMKQLLLVAEMAVEFSKGGCVTCDKFMECLVDCGYTPTSSSDKIFAGLG